jgi:hypothetical protein
VCEDLGPEPCHSILGYAQWARNLPLHIIDQIVGYDRSRSRHTSARDNNRSSSPVNVVSGFDKVASRTGRLKSKKLPGAIVARDGAS